MLIKDLAVCIQAADFSETSQVLTFFARQTGKIRCIAKGSKRAKSPFDGAIELFAFGDIVFSSSAEDKLSTLTEFEQHKPLTGLSSKLPCLNSALFAAELVNKFTKEHDPHPELFDTFLQFLKDLNDLKDSSSTWLSLLILFQLSLFKHVGLQPVLNNCINCKRKFEPVSPGSRKKAAINQFYFSSSANGLVCRDCENAFTDKIRLTEKASACLADLRLIGSADEKTIKEIETILINHISQLLGRPPKMAKYILKI